eukprot:464935-Amphidinium_carterae.1
MAETSVVERLVSYAKLTSSLSQLESADADLFSSCVVIIQNEIVQRFIALQAHGNFMVQYSQDTTKGSSREYLRRSGTV